MKLNISPGYIAAFLALLLVMLELHEIVHITVGYFICGCWGPRDFNVWSLCNACPNNESLGWIATLAGPVFSFALMYWGMVWLGDADPNRKSIGFALIFSNIPFGRITTVMMGGGDEMVVVRHFLKANFTRPEMILLGSALLLMAGLPPMFRAFKTLTNKRTWLYVTGFLTLPLLFLLVYVLVGLNSLISNGFLATPWIMGTPLLITLHTLLALIILVVFRKSLVHHTFRLPSPHTRS